MRGTVDNCASHFAFGEIVHLERHLIRLGSLRKDLRPHLRALLAHLRTASKDLFALVDQDSGSIVKVTDNPHGVKPVFWRRALPNNWRILHLKDVPVDVAWDFLLLDRNEGYVSGTKALRAAERYIYRVVEPELRAASWER